MRSRAVTFALLGALPTALLAVVVLIRSVPKFFDPCLQWGAGREEGSSLSGRGKSYSSSLALPLGGQGPCAQRIAATSETKAQAVARLALAPGGILIGSILGLLGVLLSAPALTIFAASIMFLESIALVFSFAPLTLAAGVFFLLAARETAILRRQ
jgi:hypothetical protein